MIGVCERCGAIGKIERHHPTCRACRGAYMHPDFTSRLCIPCHRGAHAILRALGINDTKVESPSLVAARMAAWFGWMGQAGRPVTFESQTISHIAIVLEEPVRALMQLEAPEEEAESDGH